MILKIFENLSWQDILNSSATCHHWYRAVQYPQMVKKSKLVIRKKEISAKEQSIQQFLTTSRYFTNLELSKVTYGKGYELFWMKFSENIQELTLSEISINFNLLISSLNRLTNLNQLELKNCRFQENKNERYVKGNNLTKLKTLNILFIKISTEQLEYLFNLIESLRIFKFSTTKNTKETILNFIKTQEKSLRSLKINTSYTCLMSLFQVKTLDLEHLVLNEFYGDNDEMLKELKKFVHSQKNLTHLSLDKCNLNDLDFSEICTNSPKLQFLEFDMYDCDIWWSEKIYQLAVFRNLRGLEISNCRHMASYILKALAVEKNEKLKDLHLCNIYCQIHDLKTQLKSMPNITCLVLQDCDLLDADLQGILSCLFKLKELWLNTYTGSVSCFYFCSIFYCLCLKAFD